MVTQIIDFNPHTADEEIFNSYLDYIDELFIELNPEDPLTPREFVKKALKNRPSGEKFIGKLVVDEKSKTTIGHLFLVIFTEKSQQYENNKHSAGVEISFLKDNYDRNQALDLLKITLDLVKEHTEVTTIDTCSYREREWKMWESLGAKLALEGAENRLYLEEVNWDLIEKWRQEGQKRAKEEEIKLISFQKCPDEILKDYTSLFTEILRLIPLGEFDFVPGDETPENRREKEQRFEELEYDWYSLATQEKNGEISGLTEIFYHKGRPHRVDQELTGVKPKYRGRGLGKWLKAEMLFFIKSKFPKVRFILTSNADMNAPMISINERMGFKTYRKEKCYTIKLNELEKNMYL